MLRLGCDRPVSRKLRCRVEVSALQAKSSWLMRRALSPLAEQFAKGLQSVSHP